MTNYSALRVARQIDALNGDAPLGAVADLVAEVAPVEVREAINRFRQRARACQEGDDLPFVRHDGDTPPRAAHETSVFDPLDEAVMHL